MPILAQLAKEGSVVVKATCEVPHFKVRDLTEEPRGFNQVWIALRNSRWCVFSLSQKSRTMSCRQDAAGSHRWQAIIGYSKHKCVSPPTEWKVPAGAPSTSCTPAATQTCSKTEMMHISSHDEQTALQLYLHVTPLVLVQART